MLKYSKEILSHFHSSLTFLNRKIFLGEGRYFEIGLNLFSLIDKILNKKILILVSMKLLEN
jgi:hypothetical protein